MPKRKEGRPGLPGENARAGNKSATIPPDASADQIPLRKDVMSVEKRSALMSRIRGKDTKPELAVGAMLAAREVRPESHPRDLPGRPDFVLRDQRLAIFVDGDFWHGWRFPLWAHKLAPFWAEKIAKNRARDRRNFAKLRRTGWTVVRIWEHDIKKDPDRVARRIEALLSAHPSERKKGSDDGSADLASCGGADTLSA